MGWGKWLLLGDIGQQLDLSDGPGGSFVGVRTRKLLAGSIAVHVIRTRNESQSPIMVPRITARPYALNSVARPLEIQHICRQQKEIFKMF